MEWRSKGSLVLSQLEEDTREALKEGLKETVPDIITSHGYKVEVHVVCTDDGYLLTLHRIPPVQSRVGQGRALFLQHGMLQSSFAWVTSGKDSLGFLLSDLGYDVWLGN